jgi:hypothetical protein
MYLYKELLRELDGYSALLYSILWKQKQYGFNCPNYSYDFLLGRMNDKYYVELHDTLIYLEQIGYIKTTFFRMEKISYEPLVDCDIHGEKLEIHFLEFSSITVSERILLSYLTEAFNNGKSRIKIGDFILNILDINNHFDVNLFRKEYDFSVWNIQITDDGYFTNEIR